jgi:hypothetical protein
MPEPELNPEPVPVPRRFVRVEMHDQGGQLLVQTCGIVPAGQEGASTYINRVMLTSRN